MCESASLGLVVDEPQNIVLQGPNESFSVAKATLESQMSIH